MAVGEWETTAASLPRSSLTSVAWDFGETNGGVDGWSWRGEGNKCVGVGQRPEATIHRGSGYADADWDWVFRQGWMGMGVLLGITSFVWEYVSCVFSLLNM